MERAIWGIDFPTERIPTMKTRLIASATALLLAAPLLAQATTDKPAAPHAHMGMGMGMADGPVTRAEAREKLRAMFTAADADKDGAVTSAEAEAVRTAHKSAMRDRMFAMIDADKSGQISRAEFDAHHRDMGEHHGGGDQGVAPSHAPGAPAKPMDMMHGQGHDLLTGADANKDGKVTLAEAESRAMMMFDKADANKDGTVTPEERRAAWKAMKLQRHMKKMN